MARQIGLAVGILLFAGPFVFDQPRSIVDVPFPETVILGAVPQPVPHPAVEIAAIEHFQGYGFDLVDCVRASPLERRLVSYACSAQYSTARR